MRLQTSTIRQFSPGRLGGVDDLVTRLLCSRVSSLPQIYGHVQSLLSSSLTFLTRYNCSRCRLLSSRVNEEPKLITLLFNTESLTFTPGPTRSKIYLCQRGLFQMGSQAHRGSYGGRFQAIWRTGRLDLFPRKRRIDDKHTLRSPRPTIVLSK